MWTAQAIAYDAARFRLNTVEKTDDDERHAAFKAVEAVQQSSKGAYWVTIEVVIRRQTV